MPKTPEALREELEALYRSRDASKIDHFFTEELLNHQPDCCSVSDEYIFLMNEAGSYYRGISQFDRSISFFQSLAQTMERFDMGASPAYATVLNNLAGSYRMAGVLDEAEQTFLHSIAVYEAAGAQTSFGYISAVNNLALCYQAKKEYQKALTYEQKALALTEEQALGLPLLATAYSNLANMYEGLGDHTAALEAIQKSIALFEEADDPHSPAYTGALYTQACLYFQDRRFEEALSLYQLVMTLTEQHFGRNADFSSAARGAAMSAHALGKLQHAVDYASQACTLDAALFGKDSPRYAASSALVSQYRDEVSHAQ